MENSIYPMGDLWFLNVGLSTFFTPFRSQSVEQKVSSPTSLAFTQHLLCARRSHIFYKYCLIKSSQQPKEGHANITPSLQLLSKPRRRISNLLGVVSLPMSEDRFELRSS